CRPRVEIELAFVLGKPLKGPGVGLPDVLRATEYVVPAIEIVDARIQDQRKIFDTVADNGAAAGIVIGGRPIGPLDVDLRWVGGIMYRNSEIEETGVAAGVLGHPALGVAWLANKLGSHGVGLEPGHLVLAGSFTRVVFAQIGDTLHADFGALGGIAVQFV
ncbi:MAG: fumarylacetoacetate hydrolase family protein, partial [Xanthobacteraceae bacterium]